DSRDNKNPEWNELLGKVETRAAAPAQPTTTASGSFLYTLLQGGQNIPDAVPAQEAGQLPQISRQVAGQVEQGMLTAMRDGATRLDLQLHPAELGAITITLVARNGAVSSQIRSEKSETAEMVSRQLDTIRVNLEQQGIKVDKIEVQMENSADQNPSTAWQDLGQHNARQEEDARREELARLRNLATVRNNTRNSDSTVLEQPVHISGQTARYAGQAMHLVA
ncbi:flagellar hook-length control protein FliK, partial [Desulfovibrio sp.]|uniref:flagellar hook-length control protein FliK n=1 Tax=Desulfovibrio sp. TaxID=885 RepID=UPI0023C0A3C9